MSENYLTINHQRGTFKVNLDAFLPCTQKEFKMILEMIDQAADCDELVNQLYAYITGQMVKNEYDLKYGENILRKYTKEDSYKKKLAALKEILEKNYTVIPAELEAEPTEKVKVKSSIVYILDKHFHDYDETGAKLVNVIGWTFDKGGYTFDIIKTEYGRYIVKLYGININGLHYKSKAAAVNSIDDNMLAILEKNADHVNHIKAQYTALMIEAGYMEPEVVKVDEPTTKRNEPIAVQAEKRIAMPGRPACIGVFVIRSSGHVIKVNEAEGQPEAIHTPHRIGRGLKSAIGGIGQQSALTHCRDWIYQRPTNYGWRGG